MRAIDPTTISMIRTAESPTANDNEAANASVLIFKRLRANGVRLSDLLNNTSSSTSPEFVLERTQHGAEVRDLKEKLFRLDCTRRAAEELFLKAKDKAKNATKDATNLKKQLATAKATIERLRNAPKVEIDPVHNEPEVIAAITAARARIASEKVEAERKAKVAKTIAAYDAAKAELDAQRAKLDADHKAALEALGEAVKAPVEVTVEAEAAQEAPAAPIETPKKARKTDKRERNCEALWRAVKGFATFDACCAISTFGKANPGVKRYSDNRKAKGYWAIFNDLAALVADGRLVVQQKGLWRVVREEDPAPETVEAPFVEASVEPEAAQEAHQEDPAEPYEICCQRWGKAAEEVAEEDEDEEDEYGDEEDAEALAITKDWKDDRSVRKFLRENLPHWLDVKRDRVEDLMVRMAEIHGAKMVRFEEQADGTGHRDTTFSFYRRCVNYNSTYNGGIYIVKDAKWCCYPTRGGNYVFYFASENDLILAKLAI